MKKEERRIFKRNKISGSVFFENGNASNDKAGNEADLLDIGTGGVSFSCDRSFRKGFVCRMFMPLKNAMVPTLVEIMWTARHGNGYKAGARFLI